jgi:signal transduction histidine kinase
VAGRLESDKIADHWQGPSDLQVWAVRDRLRHIFLNLLLNSIDAFQDSRARGRRIDVTVERPASRANNMIITYHDNASGINPSRLYVPDEYTDDPVTQQVFGAAVTSKDEGSGYGLWLARKVATEHGGSIDLLDYRNGVTFVIRLPKPDSWTPQKGKK